MAKKRSRKLSLKDRKRLHLEQFYQRQRKKQNRARLQQQALQRSETLWKCFEQIKQFTLLSFSAILSPFFVYPLHLVVLLSLSIDALLSLLWHSLFRVLLAPFTFFDRYIFNFVITVNTYNTRISLLEEALERLKQSPPPTHVISSCADDPVSPPPAPPVCAPPPPPPPPPPTLIKPQRIFSSLSFDRSTLKKTVPVKKASSGALIDLNAILAQRNCLKKATSRTLHRDDTQKQNIPQKGQFQLSLQDLCSVKLKKRTAEEKENLKVCPTNLRPNFASKLRKTTLKRSPGGTPLRDPTESKRPPSNPIHRAVMRKFHLVHRNEKSRCGVPSPPLSPLSDSPLSSLV